MLFEVAILEVSTKKELEDETGTEKLLTTTENEVRSYFNTPEARGAKTLP